MISALSLSLLLALPSPQAPAGDGVLLLTDGTRVAGRIEKTEGGYIVRRGLRRQRYAADVVQRVVPRSELEEQFGRLRSMPEADSDFAATQRAIWAFENGLIEAGWATLGELLDAGSSPPSLAQLETLAARHLLEDMPPVGNRTELARQALLAVKDRPTSPLARARNHATVSALRLLLREEEASGSANDTNWTIRKNAPTVANLCRKYGAEALGDTRRSIARRALLGHDDKGQQFVWRQAMYWPGGPSRRAVVQDVREAEQADAAARYLCRFLGHENATLKVRAAEALGELGSKEALPALRATRDAIRNHLARRGTSGAGATRGYVAFLEQQAIISDFNVEIAQAAAIADPVITTVTSGVVLDATVGGISWERWIVLLDSAVRTSIARLEGAGAAGER